MLVREPEEAVAPCPLLPVRPRLDRFEFDLWGQLCAQHASATISRDAMSILASFCADLARRVGERAVVDARVEMLTRNGVLDAVRALCSDPLARFGGLFEALFAMLISLYKGVCGVFIECVRVFCFSH